MTDKDSTPTFSPEAHRLDVGRTTLLATIVGLALTGPLTWGCLTVVLDPSAGGARWIGGFFAVLFGGLTVLFLVGLRRAVRSRGIVVDESGIWFWHGKNWDRIAWNRIERAGVSFELPPGAPAVTLEGKAQEWATDAVMDALRVTKKRRTALEIVPVTADEFDAVPRLLPYRRRDKQTTTPDLPTDRWYVPVVPGFHSWKGLMRAGERFGGASWTGFFQRPWGSIGTGWVQPRT